ncbi:hypothetical protein D9M72_305340 [compost metagenome]
MSVAWVGAGIAAVGTVSQMSASKNAASAQQGGSDAANQAAIIAQAQMREDLSPWTKAGVGAQNLLSRYLGTGGVGSSGVTSMGLATGLTPDQVRQQLTSRFTRQSAAPNAGPMYRTGQEAIDALGAQGAHDYFQQQAQNNNGSWTQPGTGPGYWGNEVGTTGSREWVSTAGGNAGPSSTIDEEGLNAEIAKYYAEQKAQEDALKADPTYGSLLRPYRNGEEFSFTGKDLLTDPGYKFGLDQGTQGIERGQASRGNFLSGGAMKELARFNEDYAGTKFNEGFGRAQSTWNTNLGAYNQNRNTIYSFLTGQSQLGQNSAAQVGASGNQTAATVGGNLTGAANAAAAGEVAGSNALVSGANSLANAYRTNNPSTTQGWNTLLNNNGGGYSGYTGYVGGNDQIANLNTSRGWTS